MNIAVLVQGSARPALGLFDHILKLFITTRNKEGWHLAQNA